MGILIKNTLIVPVDGKDQLNTWFQGDIAIDNSCLKELGNDLGEKYKGFEIIDGTGTLTMPGFINSHTHAAMTMLRGYADDMPLMEWLSQRIWPREAHLKEEDIYWGTKLSILEMIKSGTTTFADMYFFMDNVAQAAQDSGIRAVLARGMVGIGDKAQFAIDDSTEFVKKWNGKAQGRISCLLGPHAPYTCPPEYLKKVMALADELGVGLHIHLAETETEVNDMKKAYGKRPIELMESLDLFAGRHVLAAHCVHITDEEIKTLARYNVGVAHNPESNMKLASGIAPVNKLLQAGVKVGLGTDGAASNNNLDMLEEMRTCALLHKVANMDSTVLPAYSVLEMSTKNGAFAVGLKDTGSLLPGYKADIIMLDLNKPHLTPLHDPIANIVYAAQSSDVKNVIIDGKLVMKNREVLTMDEEKVLFEANRLGKDLVRRQ